MGQTRRGIQFLGWVSMIAGYGVGLLLIRGIFIGITRGFAGRPQALWLIIGYLLYLALAVYLFAIGRRAISSAKGNPRPKMRFGWGRMLLGSVLIFGAANTQFHLLPTRQFVKQLEYENQTQVTAGNVTTIALCIGSLFLIVSGIWTGFRRQSIKPNLDS